MEKKAIIHFHQGWADIIVCIGIVFYQLSRYDHIILLMREDAKPMIDFIFRNKHNIEIAYIIPANIEKRNRTEVTIVHKFAAKHNDFNRLFYGELGIPLNIQCKGGGYNYFYINFGIDSNQAYLSFLIDRDLNLEKEKYNDLISRIGTEYVIIDDDPTRNMVIDRNRIPSKKPIFNLNKSSQITFDMITVIENSKEIHLISTFWSCIIYLLQKKYNLFHNIPIYFHNYVRNGYYFHLYENHNNWIILN